MTGTMIICDVWGGEASMDHVARFVLPTSEALQLARTELGNGWLVNLRADHAWGEYTNFDERGLGEEVNYPPPHKKS